MGARSVRWVRSMDTYEFRLIRHGAVDSTNERAFAALASGDARHFDAHLALAQHAGRGRLGRTWHSPQGEGLYLSLVLLPPAPGWPAPALAMAAGLAVRDFALAAGVTDARLKWPNDVLVRGAKLAGLLVEARAFDPNAPRYVLGIGVNLKQTRFDPTLAAERAVTSLALESRALEPEDAAQQLVPLVARRLAQATRAPASLYDDYVGAAGWRGERIEIESAARVVRGRLCGIGARGIRVLPDDDGAEALSIALEHVGAVRVC
jgi:BirA family biotin operon repressor/biotin-[acetyl-CoA-carboxylase] ligase